MFQMGPITSNLFDVHPEENKKTKTKTKNVPLAYSDSQGILPNNLGPIMAWNKLSYILTRFKLFMPNCYDMLS